MKLTFLFLLFVFSLSSLAEYLYSVKENFVVDPNGPDILNCSEQHCSPIRGRSMLFLARKAGQWRPFKDSLRATIYSPEAQENLLEDRAGRVYLLTETLVCYCSDSLYECSYHLRGFIKVPRSCYMHTRSCTLFLPATQEFRIIHSDSVSCSDLPRDQWWQSPCSRNLKIWIWVTTAILTVVIITVIAILLLRRKSPLQLPKKSHSRKLRKAKHQSDDESEGSGYEIEEPVEEKRPKVVQSGGTTIIFGLLLPMFLFCVVDASVLQGTAVYECTRLNSTTESCKAYFNAQVTVPKVGMSETLVLKDDTGLETKLDITVLSEESSYNLVHEYYTSSYDMAQGSYVRCRGAWSGCKMTPNACTKHDQTDLTLRGTITLPYSWGSSECFIQSRSGCAAGGHDACHYVAWAVGANCTDELYSTTTPVFDATVKVNEDIIRLSQTTQVSSFRVNLIGSYEGAVCVPPSGRNYLLLSDNKYYFVAASSVNEGNAGKIGEVQCDINRKLTRFYATPSLNKNAQDGKFYQFPQSAYALSKSWIQLPFDDEICSWQMKTSRLLGYNNIGSPLVLEIVSYGGFTVYRTNIQCEPEITNLWTEGCSNCSQGRKVCIEAKNKWGLCTSEITTSFPTIQRLTNLNQEEQTICFPVQDEVSHCKICIGEDCIESDVSWDLEDMIEEQINNNTGLTVGKTFIKNYLKYLLIALAVIAIITVVIVVIRCICSQKRKLY